MGAYLSCWRAAAAVLFIGMGLATPGLAQLQTVTLYGKVSDSSGAVLPGVTVTLSSAQLVRGIETRVTDNAGEWRVPGLPPGTYTVAAELAGFTTAKREGIAINPGAQLRIDLVLGISTLQETVTVTGESAVVDVRNSSLQHTIDEDLISALPIQRTYSDLVTTMPGVTEGGKYTYALTQTVLGSSARDNEYMLDGQSTKISVGYSASEFSIEAMDQVQATTSGISAEFGQASGGVFSFVSKSGGDNFRGTAYYYLIDEAIQANNVTPELQRQGVKTGNEVIRDWNWGANLGGPIVRKRLWFFTDFNKMAYEQTQAGWPTEELRAQLGSDANIHEQRRLIFLKGTWQVSPNNTFASTYNRQRRHMLPSNPGADYRVDPRAWRKQYWLPQTFSERWTSVLGKTTVLEVQGGYIKVIEDNTFPFGSFDPSEVNGYQDSGSGVNYGTWDRQRGRDDARDHWDIRGSLSYFKEKFAGGSHELKTGVHRQYNWNTTWNVIPNNFQQLLRSPSTCLSLTCAVPFEIVLFNGPNASESYSTVWAGYIQDQWSLPRQRLTLNIGVRYEHADSGNPERRNGNVTPSGFDPDLDGNHVTFPTIEWFPSHVWPAREHVLVQSSIAPRFGVSWDPAGNSRFVLKGMYGRYYDKPPTAPGGGVNFSARYQWLDCRSATGAFISCQGLPANQVNGDKRFVNGEQGTLVTSNVITPEQLTSTPADPNLDYPYMDSLNVGFESAFSPTLSVSVSGIYKQSGGFTGNIDPLRPFDTAYDSVQVTNPVTNAPMTIFLEKPEFFSLVRQNFLTNLPQNERVYKGLEFVVRKRWDGRWQLVGSYLYGRAEGTLGQHYNDSAGRNLTNPNNLINDYGPLSLDSPHTIKLNGSYLAPWGIGLAVSYLGTSGVPTNSIAAELGNFYAGSSYFQFLRGVHYPATNAQGITYRETSITLPVEPRGTNRVDFRNILNLRVEKTFNLRSERRLGIMLDVLNTLNSSAVTHIQSSRREFVNFLLPEAIESPRRARVGLRFAF
jgi:hypothetical protein